MNAVAARDPAELKVARGDDGFVAKAKSECFPLRADQFT